MKTPKMVYACTFAHKTTEIDDFDRGCDPDTYFCHMHKGCNIKAESLSELIEAIGNHYCLDLDDIFIPGDADEEGTVSWFGYNRLETIYGDEPTEVEKTAWQAGNLTLYLADYSFMIEKRIVEPITEEEFKTAGIKVH